MLQARVLPCRAPTIPLPTHVCPASPTPMPRLLCQVILTLCHEGEHPIHTKDREALVESLEHQAGGGPGQLISSTLCGCLAGAGMRPTQPPAAGMPLTDALTHELLPALQMLQALREKLEALEAPAAGSGRSASSIEATREGLVQARHAWQHMLHLPLCKVGGAALAQARSTCVVLTPLCVLQILGCAGSRMRSPTANQLLMGIMIVQLDKEQPVRAIAAEVLQGNAGSRRQAVHVHARPCC